MIVKHQAQDGQYYYTVNGSNGKVLNTSETYPTRDHLNRGIDALLRADLTLIADKIPRKKTNVQPIPAPVVAAFDPAQPFAAVEGDGTPPDLAADAELITSTIGLSVYPEPKREEY